MSKQHHGHDQYANTQLYVSLAAWVAFSTYEMLKKSVKENYLAGSEVVFE